MGPKARGRQAAPLGSVAKEEMLVLGVEVTVGGDAASADHATAGGGGASAIKSRPRGSSEPRTPVHGVTHTPQQQEQRFGKRGSGQAFALGLFQILKTEDPKVIGWSASGKAFRIGDSEKFCKDIMPRFFKQNKYSSFQRQLNLYGFRKLVRGNEAGGYMHPLFERGKPEQLSQVRRGFFPEIPPEFAHDVHGHGLNDASGPDGSGVSRAAPRGRKSDGGRATATPPPGAGVGERSSSVGRSGRHGMAPAAAAAAAAVAAAAAGPMSRGVGVDGVGHVRTGSGAMLMGHRGHGGHAMGIVGDGMVMDTEWDGVQGPLPSLDVVTGGLRKLPGGRLGGGGGQGGGTEMPPTLGRLVPSADNVVSRESSPMKPGVGSDRMHVSSASGLSQLAARPDSGHHLPYGRSQDDLNLTPRSHFGAPILGLGPHASSGGSSWLTNGLQDVGGHSHFVRSSADLFASNGSGGSNPAYRSPRALQHMHSRDDLDVGRPRKTRRMGPSFNSDNGEDPSQSFLAVSPRRDSDGIDGVFMGEGYLNTVGLYPGPDDEIPPAAPRRLVSRHNTPSRPERSGAKKAGGSGGGGGGGDADDGSMRRGHKMNLADSHTMDTEDASGGGPGGIAVSHGFQLAATGFYPAMSPVTVAPGRGGFPGGRQHHRHQSSGNQNGSGGSGTGSDGGQVRSTSGWKAREVSSEEAAILRGDSPSSSRSGGGGGGGGMGMGGLGLTAHAMSRMEQVKANQRVNGILGNGNGTQGVQALGENLSQLDLSEASRKLLSRQQAGRDGDLAAQAVSQGQSQQGQQQMQQRHQRPQPSYTQPLRDESSAGVGGGHKRQVSGGMGDGQGGSGDWAPGAPGRKPTAAEAAELLRRRSSVDEVITLLSAPTSDGGFEDEGARPQQFDPAQFDSWRNSLTKVLGHLGFDFEDEQGEPQGPEGKRSPAKRISSRGTSQYLSWGGTSAMSFEEQPEEFHESLRQIPMRWRSSLSSIMTSMASNGGWDEHGGAQGQGDGGGSAVDMDMAGDGKGGGAGGERKRLEQQASLEMLQSVMRETLESMGGQDQSGADDGEEEAKAAAAAALAMGSMCRAKSNSNINTAAGGSGGGGSLLSNGSSRVGRPYTGPATSAGMQESSTHRHDRLTGQTANDAGYYKGGGAGGPYALAATAGGGGSGGLHHEHTTF